MKTILPVVVGVGLALAGAGAAARAQESAQKKVKLAIQSETLADALAQWADQTNLQLISTAEQTRVLTAPEVRGRLTPQAALDQLLADTPLISTWINERTVAISERGVTTSSSLANGAGALLAPAQPTSVVQAQTEVDKGGDSQQRVQRTARATQGEPTSSLDELEEIVVTGTRLRVRAGESAAPVARFDRQRIDELGAETIGEVLNYLPQQSFAVSEATTLAGARAVQLRGLGVGSTLVLINGRRTVTSALQGAANFFDVNSIPLAAVDRIEVLSDSASAVYGADAVGGVVNIILRRDVGEPSVDLYYGTANGDASEQRASFTGGFSRERFSASIVLDIFDRSSLSGSQRGLTADNDFTRFGGIDARHPFTNPANIFSLDGENLPGLSSPIAGVPSNSTGIGLTPADFESTAGVTHLDSINRFSELIPNSRRYSGLVSGRIDVSETSQMFGEFLYVDRREESEQAPSLLAFATVPASNPFNPFDIDVGVNYSFAGIGPRNSVGVTQSSRAVLGMTGRIGEWDWEVAALGTNEHGSLRTLNEVDTSRALDALAATDPAQALNVFQAGPGGTQSLLRSLVHSRIDRDTSRAVQGSAFVRGPILSMPAGTLDVIVGGEWRTEEVKYQNWQVAIDISPDRQSSSAFTEVRVPIVDADAGLPLIHQLSVTAASRYDRYSDFGSAFNPQYGLLWNPVAEVLVRGSYGTSFRAPSLFEVYSPATSFEAALPDPKRDNETVPVVVESGGNRELRPEESESFSAGISVTPFGPERLTLGVSFWGIRQTRRVQALDNVLILNNEEFFSDRITRAQPTPDDIAAGLPGRLLGIDATSINVGSLKTNGVDITLAGSIETNFGRWTPTLSATKVTRFETRDLPNSPATEHVGVARSQGTVPDWRAVGTLGWTADAVGLNLSLRYVSSYDDVLFDVPNGLTVSSQLLTDFQASFDLGKIWKTSAISQDLALRFGVINVFDESPHFSQVLYSLGYDASQADIRQRFTYISLTKAF